MQIFVETVPIFFVPGCSALVDYFLIKFLVFVEAGSTFFVPGCSVPVYHFLIK